MKLLGIMGSMSLLHCAQRSPISIKTIDTRNKIDKDNIHLLVLRDFMEAQIRKTW